MSFFEQLIKRMRKYIITRRSAEASHKEVNHGIRTRQARMLRR